MSADLVLTLLAVVLFALAGFNVGSPFRLEWLGAAFLAATLLF